MSEQDLEKVPSAAAADTAASVGGVTPKAFAYAGEAGGAFVPVLALGGLTLEARCVAASDLEVRANPAVPNSEIGSNFPGGLLNEADLDPGENFLVVDMGTTDGAGTIAFAGADGRVVTVTALVREDANGVRGTTNDCGFFGVAQAG